MMEAFKSSCIVLGEASESEEEDEAQDPEPVKTKVHRAIVAGEASESDCDSDADTYQITSEAFAWRSRMGKATDEVTPLKYNTLLHKKLRESNWKLKQNIKDFVKQPIANGQSQINEVNQELLATQLLLQESVSYLRRAAVSTIKLESSISSLLARPSSRNIGSSNSNSNERFLRTSDNIVN